MTRKAKTAARAPRLLFGDDVAAPMAIMGADSVDYDYPTKSFNGLALIGEAPGAEEVKRGHPFVGRSGQLLDKLLVEASIDRAACLVANVFRLRPPGNKVDHFFLSKRAAKEQSIGLAEEFGVFSGKYCRDDYAAEIIHLRETLARVKPKIIMALGRTPFWALTRESGLLSKVGKTLPCGLLTGVSVIPTYHPSFILRGNWNLQNQWLDHFQAAKKYF